MNCPSVFLGARCELPARHTGWHRCDNAHDSQTHSAFWEDASADKEAS